MAWKVRIYLQGNRRVFNMQLSEIPLDERIAVKSFYAKPDKFGNCEVNFHTNVVTATKKGILIVELIKTENGNPVNFKSDIVKTDIYYVEGDKPPIIWENVVLVRVEVKGKNYHAIYAPNSGSKMNRRNEVRVKIEKYGIARLGSSRKTSSAMIKDISCSGFSLVVPKDEPLPHMESVRFTYEDHQDHLVLTGMCVRSQDVDRDSILYGFKFPNRSDEIAHYVVKKQRAKLSLAGRRPQPQIALR